jgi:hypothetical protein
MFNPMLNRKAATENAAKHLAELVPITGTPVVEEHYFVDGVWQITLSYTPVLVARNGEVHLKEYKSFAIDGRSGEVISMKIRAPKSEK